MRTYAILLRGVTPTGKNRVPMAELRVALEAAGLAEVRTHIQSGNVVARSALARAALEARVHEVIAQAIGADLVVIARTHDEIRRMLERNPFHAHDAERTYFSLLAAAPAPALVQALRALDFSPDAVHIDGDALYTRYATKLSDSRFNNNFFERKLRVAATTRNFNTTTRLVELSAPGAAEREMNRRRATARASRIA